MSAETVLGAVLLLLGLLVIGHCIREIYGDLNEVDPPEQVDRIGYLLGQPETAQCICGTMMKRTGTFRREDGVWTEWTCPRCVK